MRCIGRLRHSRVTGNGTGLRIGGECILGGCADLGTVDEPGGNIITGNSTTGVALEDHAVGVVIASGNTWNRNTQGANNAGRYAVDSLVAGNSPDALARGKNFFLPATSDASIQF